MRAESANFLGKVTAPGAKNLDSAVFASPLYGARDNVIQFDVEADSTYQLVATGDTHPPIPLGDSFITFGPSTGNYELIISTETAAFPATAVYPISLDPSSGSGLQLGTITSAAEVDQFSFTAPVTGQITVRVNGGVTNSTMGLFQESQFVATADQSFQVRVSDPHATSQQPSLYVLTITTTTVNTDEFPDNQVFRIALDARGFGSQSGAINYAGDTDTFRFRAPLSGTMTLIMRTPDFSGLQSQVSVSLVRLIGTSAPVPLLDSSHPGNDHIVKFHVDQGTEYTVTVSGNHGTSGPYQLSLSLRPDNRPIPETPVTTQVTSTSTNTRLTVFSLSPSTGNTGNTTTTKVTVPSGQATQAPNSLIATLLFVAARDNSQVSKDPALASATGPANTTVATTTLLITLIALSSGGGDSGDMDIVAGIDGSIFQDLDGNGSRDDGEAGVAEETVVLEMKSGGQYVLAGTVTTDATGVFRFAGLGPGDYRVRYVGAGANLTTPLSYSVKLTGNGAVTVLHFGKSVKRGQKQAAHHHPEEDFVHVPETAFLEAVDCAFVDWREDSDPVVLDKCDDRSKDWWLGLFALVPPAMWQYGLLDGVHHGTRHHRGHPVRKVGQ